MTATDSSSTEPVFRLIYRSHSLIDDADRRAQLGDIFATARANNRAQEITGALLIRGDAFVQALEGEESAVRALYEQIGRDPRHETLALLQEMAAPRTFGRWSMAQVSDADGTDIRLVANAGRREIVAAGRDPSVTAEQESVLDYMHDAAAEPTLDG